MNQSIKGVKKFVLFFVVVLVILSEQGRTDSASRDRDQEEHCGVISFFNNGNQNLSSKESEATKNCIAPVLAPSSMSDTTSSQFIPGVDPFNNNNSQSKGSGSLMMMKHRDNGSTERCSIVTAEEITEETIVAKRRREQNDLQALDQIEQRGNLSQGLAEKGKPMFFKKSLCLLVEKNLEISAGQLPVSSREEAVMTQNGALQVLAQAAAVRALRYDATTLDPAEIENKADDKNRFSALATLDLANNMVSVADTVYHRAMVALPEEDGPLLDDAAIKRREVAKAYDESLQAFTKGLTAVPEHRDDLKIWWRTQIENIENEKNKNSVLAIWCMANKAESIAMVVQKKVSIATIVEAGPLLDEAIERERESAAAWDEIVKIFTQRLAALPEDRHDLTIWWETWLQSAENAKNENVVLLIWYMANKAETMVFVAYDKALHAPDVEAISCWETVETRNREAIVAWDEVINVLTQRLEALPTNGDNLKDWLSGQIERAEAQKNKYSALVALSIARKADSIALIAGHSVLTTTVVENAGLLDEVVAKRVEAATAWNMAFQAANEGLAAVPEYRDDLTIWWRMLRSIIEENKNRNSALTIWHIANKASCMAMLTENKLCNVPLAEIGSILDEAVAKRREAAVVWNQVLEIFTRGLAAVPEDCNDLKTWWNDEIKNIEHKKNENYTQMQIFESQRASVFEKKRLL